MPHSNMYNAPSTQNPDLVNGHSAPNHPPMPTQNGPVAPPTGMHNQAFGGRPPQKHPPNPMFQGPLPPGHLAPQSRPGMPPQMNSTTAPLPRPSAGTMTNSQAPLSNPASQATPTINCTPPSHTRVHSPPGELPVPYHGHAQYSHQLHALSPSDSPVTPNPSEPPSQKSSRAPSPIPGQKYDALEGQFPGSPQSPNIDGSLVQPSLTHASRSTPPNGTHQHQPIVQPQFGQPPMPAANQPPLPGQIGQTVPPPAGQMGPPGQTRPPLPGQSAPPQPGQMNQPTQHGPPLPGQLNQPTYGPPPPGQQTQHGPPLLGQPTQHGPPLLGQPTQHRPPLPGQQTQHGPPLPGQSVPPLPEQVATPGQTRPPLPGQAGPPLPAQSGQFGASGQSGPYSAPPPMVGQQLGAQVPPPTSMGQVLPPPTSMGQVPPPTGYGQPPPPPAGQGQPLPPPTGHGQPSQPYTANNIQSQPPPPQPAGGYPSQHLASNSSNSFNNMQQMHQATNTTTLNLLQELRLLPGTGLDDMKPNLSNDYKKAMCSPDIFRCTLSTLPETQALLNKARLPLGILIHPFRDLSQLPVIQSNVIVRCRSCRTYINPYVTFVDMRRWKCNLCFRINELPEEFNFDPVSRTYGEPQRRPEVRSSTIEFIAPSEYMLRPPQPAVYMFVLDVSFNAISTGYLSLFCRTLLDELDSLPGDARTHIGFLTFDRSLHFYNLAEGLSQPQMLVVSDVDDIFLPCPDSLLVNLQQSKDLVIDLLQQLPTMFESNMESGSALGAALQAAYKLMGGTGGRVTVMQTQLPTVGPGALKSREDPNQRAGGGKVSNLGPATDFYKKLSLECSAQQIAVDIFLLNTQYADMSSIACISKYSGGSVYHFNGLNTVSCPGESKRYEGTLRRYFTRKIGFEAVMRIRCTRGLSIHTFHGNFFVRSTDLLSLPNINPDAGFGMQMSIDEKLEGPVSCFQAALLYTSSKGERRIRVHTMCLPISNQLSDVYAGADQKAIIGLLAKMAVDKSLSQSLDDARDAMMYSAVDMLTAYGSTQVPQSGRVGQLPICFSLRMVPLFVMAMLKYKSFRTGISTRLDERVAALENCKTMPLQYLLMAVHPNFYPVHALDDQNAISKGDLAIPQPPLLQLCSSNMDRHGAYLLDTGSHMYLWIGASISDHFVNSVMGVQNFSEIEENMTELPDLDNDTSERLRTFIQYLNEQRPYPASLLVIREDSRSRQFFIQHLVEDRTESSMSYYEFLKYLQQEVKA